MMWRIWAPLAGAVALSGPLQAAEPKPVGSPSVAGYQPIGRDEQGIWAAASEDEREIKASKLLVRDSQLNAYLKGVLCRTVGADSCQATRIYVVRTPFFNAFSLPNGAILVNTGLLLRVNSEAELAAILGHEFSHFEHRHTLYDIRSRRNAMSWAVWLTVASYATSVPHNYTPDFQMAQASFSRDQERDADLTGLKFMIAARYQPRAASDVWAHMRQEEDSRAAALGVKSLKDAWRGPFATHPMDVERMTYLRAEADKASAGADFTGDQEFRTALAPLWAMLIDDQVKLNDFGSSEFLLNQLATPGWTGPLLYARGELYRARGKPADLPLAIDFYRRAIALPDAPAGCWRGLALALARTGDAAGAKAAVGEYLMRKPDAGDREMLLSLGEM